MYKARRFVSYSFSKNEKKIMKQSKRDPNIFYLTMRASLSRANIEDYRHEGEYVPS